MKVLVTGADGLLGRPLVRRLGARHEVTAADVAGADGARLDVTDAAAVARDVARLAPDVVVNLAAWTDVDGCERDPARAMLVNGEGARNVAAACRDAGAALLHVSTDYVFDGRKETAWTEGDPVNPLSAYGRSKLAAEEHVRALAPRWTIVRAQSLYGAGKKSFPDAILARARAGEAVRVVTDQRVQPTWVEDLAAAIEAVVTSGTGGVLHAANSGSCTWWECARAVLDLAGMSDVGVERTTAAALGRPAPRPANSVFDCSRLVRETGHVPRSWREALAEYVSGTQAQGGGG